MIVVLGGGPAGRTAAMHLAMAGKDVVLVERKAIGGQCLHNGCMMVCALNDAARVISQAANLRSLGIIDRVPEISFPLLLSGMASIQQKIASVLEAETRDCGVDIWYGREGRLAGRDVVIDGKRVDADAVIIATGSLPRLPDIPGIHLPGVFNPHSLPAMKSLPENLLIIGGGVMAAEFAFIFSQFGSSVTIASRSGFLKDLDPGIATLARKELPGVTIHNDCQVRALEGPDNVRNAVLRSPGGEVRLPVDGVCVAAGLVPNSGMLDGIEKGMDGRVVVDSYMRTSVDGVYACGDVTGSPCLTPVARHEGMVAAASVLGMNIPMDYSGIPQSMNLASEFAFVGDGGAGMVSLSTAGPAGPGTFWSVPSGMTGFARILVDPDSGVVGGVATAGPAAGIIASYHAFLMKLGVTVKDYSDFTEVHPMTDGVYPLMKYAHSRMESGKPFR